MDSERFDGLARGLAMGRSRRQVLRGLAGSAAGGALALLAAPAPRTGAVVGGYVEVHMIVCLEDQMGEGAYDRCHENRLVGVEMIAEGPGGVRYEDVTDAEGIVVFGDFLEAGTVTVATAAPSGDFSDYTVVCVRVDTHEPIAVEKRGNGRAAVAFDLPAEVVEAGSGVVCDWYNVAPAQTGSGSIEIHQSVCPAGTTDDYFTRCHANGLARTTLILTGPEATGPNRFEGTTAGPIGAVLFPNLSPGTYTIAEATPFSDYAEYAVYCSDADGNEVPIDYRGDGRAAVQLALAAGQAVVCDWYNVAAAHAVPAPPVAPEAPAGAIGLTRVHWEEIHGPGVATGAAYAYEDGAYAAAFTGGIVTFVETGWEEQDGIRAVAANAVARQLLPADAELVERYFLPATETGPIALAVERYVSPYLAGLPGAGWRGTSGSIAAVYQLSKPGERDETRIFRISLAAGTAV